MPRAQFPSSFVEDGGWPWLYIDQAVAAARSGVPVEWDGEWTCGMRVHLRSDGKVVTVSLKALPRDLDTIPPTDEASPKLASFWIPFYEARDRFPLMRDRVRVTLTSSVIAARLCFNEHRDRPVRPTSQRSGETPVNPKPIAIRPMHPPSAPPTEAQSFWRALREAVLGGVDHAA